MRIKTFLGIAITLLVLSVSKIQAQQVVLIEVQESFSIYAEITIKTIYPDNSIEITEYNKEKGDKIDKALLTKKEIEKWVKQGFSLVSISDISVTNTTRRYRTIVLIKKED